jgi:chaperonin GroEL
MAKLILFDDEARQALSTGANMVANAVKKTLGPRGRNVAIDRHPHAPLVTHDGVTVAKDIELKDVFENMGAQLIKAAALRTNDMAGDGTTTATVVAQLLISEGMHAMASGANPMLLKRGIDRGVEYSIQVLRGMARSVNGHDDIAAVGTIASTDPEIGNLLADLMDRVGKDGVITVELGHKLGISSEFQEGLDFDHGWASPMFITDQARQEGVVEDTLVLVTAQKIDKASDIVPILQRILEAGEKNVFVIAEEFNGEGLGTLSMAKLNGKLNIGASKTPGYGDRRKIELEDIAAITGATVITEDLGIKLEDATVAHLGRARRIVSGKDRTTIVGLNLETTAIQSRIKALRGVLADTMADYDREWMRKRLARLSSGIGVIRVGASTSVEAEEKKARIEDALSATRAAVAEGILPGGGVALVNVAQVLADFRLPGDMGVGVDVLRRAMEEPLRLLVANAGASPSVVIDTLRRLQIETGNKNLGYNVVNGAYVDMFEAGVIDPVKVTRVALENAASVAGSILTTEALVSDPREKPKKDTGKHPHGMPY